MSHYDPICSRERFAKDTATHQMQIIRDDGVYRHLRFKRPDENAYYFDIVTWPGYLAITGDMGANLFSRVDDMFEFFRTDRENSGCNINPGYWGQKLQCDGDRDSIKEFDSDEFKRVINEYRARWMREMKENGDTKENRRELWEAVDDQVLCYIDEGKHRAGIAAFEFSHCPYSSKQRYQFDELWEHKFDKFTLHYIWRCRAIAWAIEQYDAAKAQEQLANTPSGDAQ